MMRKRALIVVAAVLVSLFPSVPATAQTDPNIVLLNVDDLDFTLLEDPALDAYFPNIATHLRDAGLRLDNLHVTTPLCGPSRASLLRGQQAHNTGVFGNTPAEDAFPPLTGGFAATYEGGFTSDELATWLSDAGYTTMLVGKYLHTNYPDASGHNRFEPPHWDEFHASLGGRYYGYPRQINGVRIPGSESLDAFRTDVEAESARQLIAARAPEADPFFLYLAPFAPHLSETPMYPPRYEALYPGVQIPRTADFNETDISDKPTHLQSLPLLPPEVLASLDATYRDRIRSMKAVDDMVGVLVAELEAQGELANTYIMLTSDNGFSLGHNRLIAKQLPFDRMTRVGMLVRGPGVPAGTDGHHLLAHTDIAPTIVELAGGQSPSWVDGASFVEVLTDPASTPLDAVRPVVVIENWERKNQRGQTIDGEYTAIRGVDATYVHWANGAREFYDLSTDPLQLDNAYETLPSGFQAFLGALTDLYWQPCTGTDCSDMVLRTDPPTAVVDRPFHQTMINGPVTVTGTAFDAEGVSAVDVIVRPRNDDLYWNGVAYAAAFMALPATLAAPGASETTFTLTLNLPDRHTDVFVRARDTDGNTQPDAVFRRLRKFVPPGDGT